MQDKPFLKNKQNSFFYFKVKWQKAITKLLLFGNKTKNLKPAQNKSILKPTIEFVQATEKKETLAQVFSCEFYKISKNTLFTEHLSATASDRILLCLFK